MTVAVENECGRAWFHSARIYYFSRVYRPCAIACLEMQMRSRGIARHTTYGNRVTGFNTGGRHHKETVKMGIEGLKPVGVSENDIIAVSPGIEPCQRHRAGECRPYGITCAQSYVNAVVKTLEPLPESERRRQLTLYGGIELAHIDRHITFGQCHVRQRIGIAAENLRHIER